MKKCVLKVRTSAHFTVPGLIMLTKEYSWFFLTKFANYQDFSGRGKLKYAKKLYGKLV